MEETLNYIKVLNWGYDGFAPMTLSTDFAKSLLQVQERLGVLDSLNYGELLVEANSANGKANLLKYQSTDNTIEYSLHFLRDRKEFLEMLQPDYLIEIDKSHKPPKPVWHRNPKRMFRWAFDAIDKFKADGLWTDEQWREYKGTLSQIEKGLEDRLKQFAAAYELIPARARTPKNIRGGGRKPSKDSPKPVEKIVEEENIIGEPLCNGAPLTPNGWLSFLKKKHAVWQSLDFKTLIKALKCGDVATITTGTNKPILVALFKAYAFGYCPECRIYANSEEEKDNYKRVCMESAGFNEDQFRRATVGKLTENEKAQVFPLKYKKK